MKKYYVWSGIALVTIIAVLWIAINASDPLLPSESVSSRVLITASDTGEAVGVEPPQRAIVAPEMDRLSQDGASIQEVRDEDDVFLAELRARVSAQAIPEVERRPPFMDSSLGALMDSPTESAVSYLAAVSRYEAGPASLERATAYLQAQDAVLPYVGARMLVMESEWTREALDRVIDHENIGVPLYVWQGLLEEGRVSDAEALADDVSRRVANYEQWGAGLAGAAVPGVAVRGLINLAEGMLSPEQFNEMLNHLVENDASDYSGRMRALMEQRFTLPFDEYRNRVHDELLRSSQAPDPVWSEGVRRLANELEGPLPVVAGPVALTPDIVDMMEAHEYPAMLEDITLRVEVALRSENAVWGVGVVDRLKELMEKHSALPLDESEKMALQRLAAAVSYIQEVDIAPGVAAPIRN